MQDWYTLCQLSTVINSRREKQIGSNADIYSLLPLAKSESSRQRNPIFVFCIPDEATKKKRRTEVRLWKAERAEIRRS
jgi:hypothetical protein